MTGLVEFYPERQGRPDSKIARDMNTGRLVSNLGRVLHTSDIDDEPVDTAKSSPISSKWAYDHVEEMERQLRVLRSVVKALLRTLWDDVDWGDVDIDEIDWDEWEW